MKTLVACFLFLICSGALNAQSLKKYPISTSGCTAYFYCDPGKFKKQLSADSSVMFIGGCAAEDVSYSIVCVKLASAYTDMKDAEGILIAYLDHLKNSFGITKAAGYGKGHTLNGNANTKGIIDYWTDKDNNQLKVKGWTNGKYIAVLYVSSSKDLPETKVNFFLDGFRFP